MQVWNEYMSELISNDKVKARHFYATKRFIDDGGVFNDVNKDICPSQIKTKSWTLWYTFLHSGTHATILNCYITVKDGVFVYKRFDKAEAFPFFLIRIPFTCHDSSIPKSIFYSALVGKFLRIARGFLLHKDFNGKAVELLNRMKAQGPQSLWCRKHYPKSNFFDAWYFVSSFSFVWHMSISQ